MIIFITNISIHEGKAPHCNIMDQNYKHLCINQSYRYSIWPIAYLFSMYVNQPTLLSLHFPPLTAQQLCSSTYYVQFIMQGSVVITFRALCILCTVSYSYLPKTSLQLMYGPEVPQSQLYRKLCGASRPPDGSDPRDYQLKVKTTLCQRSHRIRLHRVRVVNYCSICGHANLANIVGKSKYLLKIVLVSSGRVSLLPN